MRHYKFSIDVCRDSAIAGIFVFCLVQLSGCSFVGKSHDPIDGAPAVDVDAATIPDAIPKREAYHPYGTRDYVVGGRRYHVLKSSKGYVRRGYASWYGSKFHGNYTSTQERYNLYGMTAASTELPLPSYVQVTNLQNGKKIVVRVNDRGPFHSKRILDLSYMGAKKLGFVEEGIAPVKIVAIDPKTWNKKNAPVKATIYAATKTSKLAKHASAKPSKGIKSPPKSAGKIYLQVGAFAHIDNAKQLSAKIAGLTNKPTHIDHSASLYRVKIGPMAYASQGDQLKLLLEKNGFNKVVVITN